MTLQLFGPLTIIKDDVTVEPLNVIRLNSPLSSEKLKSADFTLIESHDDINFAASNRDPFIFGVGDVLRGQDLTPFQKVLQVDKKFSYLGNGDILGINPNGRGFRTLYRHSSQHNSFLVTEQCNHNCLMCSQPPKKVDDRWLLEEISAAIPLVDPCTQSIGFTGGEPLTNSDEFIKILELCRDTLPSTVVHVLTNGRAFRQSSIAKAWANIRHPDLTAGIPIYSSNDTLHDYIVQSPGAFDETVMGILQLKERKQRVEIRLVLHALTVPGLYKTCEWFSRNLPFVDHVALMGLENTGFAIANNEQLWIDPVDYQFELGRSVEVLRNRGIRTSIYNLPRCVVPVKARPYARQSISDWKQGFLEVCSDCTERPVCSGFFTSGRPKEMRGIRPFLP